MKRIQIEVPANALPDENDIEILRAGGVKRIDPGWYSVVYNGVNCDPSTVVRARRNRRGEISHGNYVYVPLRCPVHRVPPGKR